MDTNKMILMYEVMRELEIERIDLKRQLEECKQAKKNLCKENRDLYLRALGREKIKKVYVVIYWGYGDLAPRIRSCHTTRQGAVDFVTDDWRDYSSSFGTYREYSITEHKLR